jgi:cytochrome c1
MKRAFVLLLVLAACKQENGNAQHGKELMQKYGCTYCHAIPGVPRPRGSVAPPLDHVASRTSIAGKFPNNRETMMKWLQNPQSMDPQNEMPNLNVTPEDSRDMAAYLYTLK